MLSNELEQMNKSSFVLVFIFPCEYVRGRQPFLKTIQKFFSHLTPQVISKHGQDEVLEKNVSYKSCLF